MFLVGKTGDVEIRLRIEMGGDDPPLRKGAEHRQMRLAPGRQRPGEMMHQRSDENSFAGARQARDAKPQPRARDEIREALGGDPRLEPDI